MILTSNIIPFEGEHTEDELRLFGRFQRLYRIKIEGQTFMVPEDNSLLRCIQYIELKYQACQMPWRNYCWNDTEGCCKMRYRKTVVSPEEEVRACTIRVRPGMEILKLPKGGQLIAPTDPSDKKP